MEIGKLNKRLILQNKTTVPDGMGGFSDSYYDEATVWGAIWPSSGKEVKQSDRTTMVIMTQIRIRYRSYLKPWERVKYGHTYYNIIKILNPKMRNEWLDLMCKDAT